MTAKEIKATVVLSDYIGEMVPLSGPVSGWQKGHCPFHDDRHPSFLVNNQLGIWRCYPCGLHGDVFDWIAKTQGLDFLEAKAAVCKREGLAYKEEKKEDEARKEQRAIYELLGHAAKYFETCLTSEHRALIGERYHLSNETIDNFHLGFGSPEFLSAMDSLGVTNDELIRAGLLNSEGRFPLANRIIIPYLVNKEVVYMSGRSLEANPGKWKYLHLSLSRGDNHVHPCIYKPIFNLDRVPRATRIYLVEGVFDAMAVQERSWDLGGGIAAIAVSGSHVTARDAGLLRTYAGTAEITIVPDGDNAGMRGAMASAGTLVSAGMAPSIWIMPVGQDAASVGDGLIDLPPPISLAETWVRLLAPLKGQERERAFVDDVLPLLAHYPVTQQDDAIDQIASGLNIKVATLKATMRQHQKVSDKAAQSPAGAVLLEYFEPLAYEQTKSTTHAVLWSKQRDVPVYLNLTKTNDMFGTLAPHVGDLDGILSTRLPDSTPAERKFGLNKALQIMSQNLRRFDDFEVMRSGFHHGSDGSLVLIGQEGVMLREPGEEWRHATRCVHGDKLMMRDFNERDPWLEFSAGELNRPLVYEPEEVFDLLWRALRRAWEWTTAEDARLWALNCFALTWTHCWDVMPWFHITAPASSGKSTLCEGFLSGRGLLRNMGGPFIMGAAPEEDPTEAGIRAKYSNTMRTLILDEFEAEEKNLMRVLRTMRTSRTGGGSIRGTQEGGFRESYLNNPLIISSIGAVTADADASRLTITRLLHTDDFPSPMVTVRDMWADLEIDTREMRRTILLAFQDNWQEMQQCYRDMQRESLPFEELSSPRGKENLTPAIAVAKFLGKNYKEIAEKVFTAHVADYHELDAGSREALFEEHLLHRSFRYQDSQGQYMTTIWSLRGAPMAMTLPYGFVWDAKAPHLLCVHPANLTSIGPLAGIYVPNTRQLNSLMKECPHFMWQRPLSKAGVFLRWTVFDFHKEIEREYLAES